MASTLTVSCITVTVDTSNLVLLVSPPNPRLIRLVLALVLVFADVRRCVGESCVCIAVKVACACGVWRCIGHTSRATSASPLTPQLNHVPSTFAVLSPQMLAFGTSDRAMRRTPRPFGRRSTTRGSKRRCWLPRTVVLTSATTSRRTRSTPLPSESSDFTTRPTTRACTPQKAHPPPPLGPVHHHPLAQSTTTPWPSPPPPLGPVHHHPIPHSLPYPEVSAIQLPFLSLLHGSHCCVYTRRRAMSCRAAPSFRNYSVCTALGKPIWASEESSSYDDANGAACWARVVTSHYVLNGMTASIMWNLVGSCEPPYDVAFPTLLACSRTHTHTHTHTHTRTHTHTHTHTISRLFWYFLLHHRLPPS
jgi:hypothetical protein